MNDILSYWKLDETKQVAITTDNGANVKKAGKDNSWTNLSCFGHNLHLAITNTLANESRVKRSLGTCKKIVAASGTSWKRRGDMTAAQLQEESGQKVKQLVSVSFFITKE